MSEYVGLKQGKVHESHVISEYYCGGCGWPVTDHDSYCPECGGELHEGMGKSRWHELFGTPEKTARTFADFCGECASGNCCGCPLDRLTDQRIGYNSLLKWLLDDTSEVELCSFCYGEARLMAQHFTDDSHIYWVECKKCGMEGPHMHEGVQAIVAWNGIVAERTCNDI